jgi:hypothetical protein
MKAKDFETLEKENPPAASFIKKCLLLENERMTSKEALNHKFISNVSNNLLKRLAYREQYDDARDTIKTFENYKHSTAAMPALAIISSELLSQEQINLTRTLYDIMDRTGDQKLGWQEILDGKNLIENFKKSQDAEANVESDEDLKDKDDSEFDQEQVAIAKAIVN